jgi:hypothetical protein
MERRERERERERGRKGETRRRKWEGTRRMREERLVWSSARD